MNAIQIIKNGIVKENPTFVLMLGMCPTLATTTSAMNGMSMGLATMAVLICTNFVISCLKSVTPDKVRIPVFIVVIAAFVTILQMVIKAYLPDVDASLGLFIPLIVVNCIILGRAEAFAAKNSPIASLFDGIGIGLGFTLPRAARLRFNLRINPAARDIQHPVVCPPSRSIHHPWIPYRDSQQTKE